MSAPPGPLGRDNPRLSPRVRGAGAVVGFAGAQASGRSDYGLGREGMYGGGRARDDRGEMNSAISPERVSIARHLERQSVVLLESTIPRDMTCEQWRRLRSAESPAPIRGRLM